MYLHLRWHDRWNKTYERFNLSRKHSTKTGFGILIVGKGGFPRSVYLRLIWNCRPVLVGTSGSASKTTVWFDLFNLLITLRVFHSIVMKGKLLNGIILWRNNTSNFTSSVETKYRLRFTFMVKLVILMFRKCELTLSTNYKFEYRNCNYFNFLFSIKFKHEREWKCHVAPRVVA